MLINKAHSKITLNHPERKIEHAIAIFRVLGMMSLIIN